ncbi:MAG TPA: VOC family protein [Planctomycetota bacterium]|nr:VOC family protein [Planctomycetota bacterium]
MQTQKIAPCLWFDGNAEDAAKFYVSVFPNSRIVSIMRTPAGSPIPAGSVLVVYFELEGQSFIALNGGPQFKFNEAISLSVSCETQQEVDVLWKKLTDGGGVESECAWLKDKFGVSWQIVPNILPRLLMDSDPAKASRAFLAMMTMRKIDIDKIKRAAEGA